MPEEALGLVVARTVIGERAEHARGLAEEGLQVRVAHDEVGVAQGVRCGLAAAQAGAGPVHPEGHLEALHVRRDGVEVVQRQIGHVRLEVAEGDQPGVAAHVDDAQPVLLYQEHPGRRGACGLEAEGGVGVERGGSVGDRDGGGGGERRRGDAHHGVFRRAPAPHHQQLAHGERYAPRGVDGHLAIAAVEASRPEEGRVPETEREVVGDDRACRAGYTCVLRAEGDELHIDVVAAGACGGAHVEGHPGVEPVASEGEHPLQEEHGPSAVLGDDHHLGLGLVALLHADEDRHHRRHHDAGHGQAYEELGQGEAAASRGAHVQKSRFVWLVVVS